MVIGLNLSDSWTQLLMQCGSWLIYVYTVLSLSSVLSAGVMAVLLMLLSLLLLSIHTPSQASLSCPVSCRCYSLTVECGSTGLRDIPKHVPPSTQVGFWCWRRTIADITTRFDISPDWYQRNFNTQPKDIHMELLHIVGSDPLSSTLTNFASVLLVFLSSRPSSFRTMWLVRSVDRTSLCWGTFTTCTFR